MKNDIMTIWDKKIIELNNLKDKLVELISNDKINTIEYNTINEKWAETLGYIQAIKDIYNTL